LGFRNFSAELLFVASSELIVKEPTNPHLEMEISLLRHAESKFNTGESNQEDVGLSKQGVQRASELKGEYDLIICSPLRRCRETLKYSKLKATEIQIDPLVREHITERSDLLPDEPYQKESDDAVVRRVEDFKEKVQLYSGKILVITHADWIWYATSKILEGERFGTWVGNAEIITLFKRS